jgi:hypothetical protein
MAYGLSIGDKGFGSMEKNLLKPVKLSLLKPVKLPL